MSPTAIEARNAPLKSCQFRRRTEVCYRLAILMKNASTVHIFNSLEFSITSEVPYPVPGLSRQVQEHRPITASPYVDDYAILQNSVIYQDLFTYCPLYSTQQLAELPACFFCRGPAPHIPGKECLGPFRFLPEVTKGCSPGVLLL